MNGPGNSLPIATALPELSAVLAAGRRALLQAPPGAGKSTGVPLALLDAPWLKGRRIVLLEPRRLAARAVAARMASTLGEQPGGTVGYRMRLDTRVGPRTRIEVVTEGILTRQLQRDPALEGIGLVIFDEFHERSLQADTGLAFVLDAQRHLAPDLRILVMSATLDGAALARLLEDAPIVTAPGLSYPVDTRYAERTSTEFIDRQATAAIRRALRDNEGDILVFLPGAGEIRRVEHALLGKNIHVRPLYGDLDREAQDLAIRPAPAGQRKVVLATNIAETSLTIEGIRVVIDGGLERRNRFDPRSGMSRLETGRISQASADQRRGRAGRLAPGICYRLWTATEHRALLPHTPPEIVNADLAPLALELAGWGARDPDALTWLTPPPTGALAQSRELLKSLGALEQTGSITPHGRDMLALAAHPRLAHLLLGGKAAGVGGTACALAATLGERDLLRGRPGGRPGERDADLRTRLEVLARDSSGTGHDDVDRGTLRQIRRSADAYSRQLDLATGTTAIEPEDVGWLLALAYPDRIARTRDPGSGRYLLSNGRGAFFAEPQSLAKADYLVIPELEGGEKEARIYLAAPVAATDLERHLADSIVSSAEIRWDSREQAVSARRQRRLGALVLADEALRKPDAVEVTAAMVAGIRELGLTALPWNPELRQWQARVLLCRATEPDSSEPWPDVSDAALLITLESWLAPWLDGVSRASHMTRIDLAGALHALLTWPRQQRLAELAPTHLTVPSGSHIAIDYLAGPVPSLSVRLQEVFGLTATPRVAGGRVPVLLKLLSPARRPVQVTQDLESFWNTAYHEVRKELKGRYPRHYWPVDPRQAEPTKRVKPR